MKLELISLLILGIFFIAFAFVSSLGIYEWRGTDSQAEGVVARLTENSYQPWIEPIWEPTSIEIGSLFFSLPAAVGGFIIGYFLGYYQKDRAA
ncbi:MAG: cobalt transport protein CbiN [Methanotrichaceae archaeon]|nr:cobalt transport protein CbiN [Methanotrichaceae archaeon]